MLIRAPVENLVEGRVALVSGGGGSIGSELVRQLHELKASKVYVLDHDEASLYAMSLELSGNGLFADDTAILADVRDQHRMLRLMTTLRPDLVFHAAAHKHLALIERFPEEALKTNFLGTCNLVEACAATGVERVINISTDKAANPASILGLTKRLAEAAVSQLGEGLRRGSVRFGNVLASSGSFLAAVAWQVERRQPVAITDPEVTRFFMSIPEAVSLVLEAAAMATTGNTYVLDMGPPVKIVDLVRRYCEWAGAGDPELVYTGLRPGEKLHEELHDGAEARQPTADPRISCIAANEALAASPEWDRRLDDIRVCLHEGEDDQPRLRLPTVC